jgi:glycosyltransferase involved in cell wall biosynthesis
MPDPPGAIYPPLRATEPAAGVPSRPLKVCIVSNGILGPIRNGGIATLYMGLAETLVEAGHDVTYLYTAGDFTEARPVEEWVEHYRERGIRLVPLPEPKQRVLNSFNLRTAYATYLWLQQNDQFDVIHFHEWQGHAFYSLLAKRQGLAFSRTTLCVSTHSPTCWNKQGNHEYLNQVQDLETDYLERQSLWLADILISSSQYMLNWVSGQGWRLPKHCHVQPNVLPPTAIARLGIDLDRRTSGAGPAKIEEIVFFGRLEGRKGLALFCDALDRLAGRDAPGFRVTFLGKNGSIAGQSGLEYLERRSGIWDCTWEAITTLDNVEAMAYLRQPGRIAVMPSLMDNSPLALQECLLAGVPFLATDVGGIPEMIRPEDRADVLFTPRPAALADRLERVLREGLAVKRPAVDERESRRAWVDWHDSLPRREQLSNVEASASVHPKVSVCVTHHNRPHYLAQALDSLRAQDYPCFEVLVVDDGSTKPVALAYLAWLETEFRDRGWQLIRQANLYPGAARNNAARHARGEYLVFMDDDNLLKPDAISRFVAVARTTGADILTCFADVFHGHEAPRPRQQPEHRWLHLGDCLSVGTFYNCLGDTNAIIRRDSFFALGGFTEDFGHNHEDKELFTRAVLRGYHLEVIPEALYWYRENPQGINLSSDPYLNHMRGLRPYREVLPPSMEHLLNFALAHFLHANAFPKHHPREAAASPAPWPLRYRIVDRVNQQIKRFSWVHRSARSLIVGLVELKRAATRQLRAIGPSPWWPRTGAARSGARSLALKGPHRPRRSGTLEPASESLDRSER